VLLGERRDEFGNRLPALEWRLLEEDWESIVRTAALVATGLEWWHGAETYLWIDAGTPWPWAPGGPTMRQSTSSWGNHHLGTTRMADRSEDGVVDRNCRVHGLDNLYVAGSSVFPTGSHANPTFMIVALAHRLADHLASTR
jgi:choline dehydrogenase-like flavoprotein